MKHGAAGVLDTGFTSFVFMAEGENMKWEAAISSSVSNMSDAALQRTRALRPTAPGARRAALAIQSLRGRAPGCAWLTPSWHVYMCVCVYTCVHARVHVCVYAYACVHVCACEGAPGTMVTAPTPPRATTAPNAMQYAQQFFNSFQQVFNAGGNMTAGLSKLLAPSVTIYSTGYNPISGTTGAWFAPCMRVRARV